MGCVLIAFAVMFYYILVFGWSNLIEVADSLSDGDIRDGIYTRGGREFC
jgi:hypothetical protein